MKINYKKVSIICIVSIFILVGIFKYTKIVESKIEYNKLQSVGLTKDDLNFMAGCSPTSLSETLGVAAYVHVGSFKPFLRWLINYHPTNCYKFIYAYHYKDTKLCDEIKGYDLERYRESCRSAILQSGQAKNNPGNLISEEKTYRNDKYRFEFQFPEETFINMLINADQELKLAIQSEDLSNKDLRVRVTKYIPDACDRDFKEPGIELREINGVGFVYIPLKVTKNNYAQYFSGADGGLCYSITLLNEKKSESFESSPEFKIFNGIVNTFKIY